MLAPLQKPFTHIADAGGLRVVEKWHAPGVRVPWHVNDRPVLTCVLQGGFEESLRSNSIECAAPTVLFKPPGELHSNCAGRAGAHSLAIEFPEQRAATVCVPCDACTRYKPTHWSRSWLRNCKPRMPAPGSPSRVWRSNCWRSSGARRPRSRSARDPLGSTTHSRSCGRDSGSPSPSSRSPRRSA